MNNQKEFLQDLIAEALEKLYDNDEEVELILERLYDFIDNM